METNEYRPLVDAVHAELQAEIDESFNGALDAETHPLRIVQTELCSAIEKTEYGGRLVRKAPGFAEPEDETASDNRSLVELHYPPLDEETEFPAGFDYLRGNLRLIALNAENNKYGWWFYICNAGPKPQALVVTWYDDEGAPAYATLFEFEQPVDFTTAV